MATNICPQTGVELNPILIERRSLTYDQAVTAWILRMEGNKYSHVAQRLGTNPHRVGEVFRGEKYPDARERAMQILIRGH